MKPPSEWRRFFSHRGGEQGSLLLKEYGEEGVASSRMGMLKKALCQFESAFPGRGCFVVRVPGRINLLGMHVDHQGGRTNYLLIDREIFLAASPREDGLVALENVEAKRFPPRRFRIREEFPPERRGRWREFIEWKGLPQGDWANYVKAGVLKVQDIFSDGELRGFEAVVCGDIPIGAGMSSSSALVVASSLSALEANGLDISPSELAEACGEGEWLVGTRGGCGDHAAMLLSKRGKVLHASFFALRIRAHPLP